MHVPVRLRSRGLVVERLELSELVERGLFLVDDLLFVCIIILVFEIEFG